MSTSWPNLFVAGAPKAGTTSLWRYLGQHPMIYMAPMKEPNYFSGHRPRGRPRVADEASYLRLFAPGAEAKLRGEASPSYLWRADVAAPAIKRVSPAARIVIMLRDPVDRAHSSYWHAVRNGTEQRPFLEALHGDLRDRRPDGLPSRYVDRSLYAEAVERYLRLFPGTVHVGIFEEFFADVPGELRGLFEFLGVDTEVAVRIEPRPHNPFARPRSRVAGRIFISQRARAAGRLLVPLSLRPRVDQLLLKGGIKPELEAEACAILTAHYATDVARLQEVLGRTLPWDRFRGVPVGAAPRIGVSASRE
jgi:sulfotransferase family protein